MLPELIFALALDPGADAETLMAADQAAQAHEYERATALCLELADHEETTDQLRQDAVQAALGYADMAYEHAGSVEPLCQAYTSLVEHGRGDVLTLKPQVEARLESIAGASWRPRCAGEHEASVAPADDSEPEARTTVVAEAPAEPALPPRPASASFVDDARRSPRSRRLLISGTTLVSIGAASLAGMGATFIVWNHNGARINAITASVLAGKPKTPAMDAEVERLENSSVYLKPLAITTGAFGAVTLITGAALLIAGRKRSRDLNLTPTFTRTFGGLTLTTRF